jgi:hypothetical protein
MFNQVLISALLVSTVIAAPAAQAASTERTDLQQVLACWDGTFAYNSFRVESSSQRYYISLKGSQLVKKAEFYATNDVEQLRLGSGWDDVNQISHVSFLAGACTLAPDGASLSCAKGDLMADADDESFYRTKRIDELGTTRDITSRFRAQRLELVASPSGLTLNKIRRFSGTGEIVTQTLAIRCSGTNDNFAPYVAPALVDYLEPR